MARSSESRMRQSALEGLGDLSTEEREGLRQALIRAPSNISQKGLAEFLSSEAKLPLRLIWLTLGLLWSLRRETRRLPEDTHRSVVHQVVEKDIPEAVEDGISLGEFLTSLLENIGTLEACYDITATSLEHEQLYEEAKVLVDFRPVFDRLTKDQEKGEISAGVLTHTLKITFSSKRTPAGESIYLVLNGSDLQALRKELDSAISRARTVRETLGLALDMPITDD